MGSVSDADGTGRVAGSDSDDDGHMSVHDDEPSDGEDGVPPAAAPNPFTAPSLPLSRRAVSLGARSSRPSPSLAGGAGGRGGGGVVVAAGAHHGSESKEERKRTSGNDSAARLASALPLPPDLASSALTPLLSSSSSSSQSSSSVHKVLGEWAMRSGAALFPPARVANPRPFPASGGDAEVVATLRYFVDFDSPGPPSFASVSPRLLGRAALGAVLNARKALSPPLPAPQWLVQGDRFAITQCKQHDGRWQLMVVSSRSAKSLNDDLFTAIGYHARVVPPKKVYGNLGPIPFACLPSVMDLADTFPSLSIAPNYTALDGEAGKVYRNSVRFSIDEKERPAFHRAALALLPRLIMHADDPRHRRAAVCSHCTQYGHLRARCPSIELRASCARCGLSGHLASSCQADALACGVCGAQDHTSLRCPRARRVTVVVPPPVLPPAAKASAAPLAPPARAPSCPAVVGGPASKAFVLPPVPVDRASAAATIQQMVALMASMQGLLQACLALLSAPSLPSAAPDAAAASSSVPPSASSAAGASAAHPQVRVSAAATPPSKRKRTAASSPAPASHAPVPLASASASLGLSSASASAPHVPVDAGDAGAKSSARVTRTAAAAASSSSSSSSRAKQRDARQKK